MVDMRRRQEGGENNQGNYVAPPDQLDHDPAEVAHRYPRDLLADIRRFIRQHWVTIALLIIAWVYVSGARNSGPTGGESLFHSERSSSVEISSTAISGTTVVPSRSSVTASVSEIISPTSNPRSTSVLFSSTSTTLTSTSTLRASPTATAHLGLRWGKFEDKVRITLTMVYRAEMKLALFGCRIGMYSARPKGIQLSYIVLGVPLTVYSAQISVCPQDFTV
ncbi:hypothetical protein BDV93DRAFT_608613 [Ceratobasidium sp. AG-I]|nr:hypothetical protein BDV93DRAFT_608613 [Ceratobasidium sp. AG-I]